MPMTRQTVAGCGWCRSRANDMRRQIFNLKVARAICFTGAASSKSEVKIHLPTTNFLPSSTLITISQNCLQPRAHLRKFPHISTPAQHSHLIFSSTFTPLLPLNLRTSTTRTTNTAAALLSQHFHLLRNNDEADNKNLLSSKKLERISAQVSQCRGGSGFGGEFT